jgi:hypothetical protein
MSLLILCVHGFVLYLLSVLLFGNEGQGGLVGGGMFMERLVP